MSINRGIGKDDVEHIKWNITQPLKGRTPFAATWMVLQSVILSEVQQRKTSIAWYCLYVESKKRVQMNLSTKQK